MQTGGRGGWTERRGLHERRTAELTFRSLLYRWWLLVPVDAYHNGDDTASVASLVAAQKFSVATREGNAKRHTTFGKASHNLVARARSPRYAQVQAWRNRNNKVQPAAAPAPVAAKVQKPKVLAAAAPAQEDEETPAPAPAPAPSSGGNRYYIIP